MLTCQRYGKLRWKPSLKRWRRKTISTTKKRKKLRPNKGQRFHPLSPWWRRGGTIDATQQQRRGHHGFIFKPALLLECETGSNVLVTVKPLPAEACQRRRLWHMWSIGVAGGRSQRRTKLAAALVLVTGHRSSVAGRQALHPHMDPRPHPSCPCKIFTPILNNSVLSRSLPPEGLVSWRHHWDDLTAPERSGDFFFHPLSHPLHIHLCHTYTQAHTHAHTYK